MTENNEHKDEFSKAWDEVKKLRENPDFDLQIFLADKKETLSPETITELKIAYELHGLLELDTEYESQIPVKQIREGRKIRLTVLYGRALSIAACAAILLIAFICVTYLRQQQSQKGFEIIAGWESLIGMACEASQEFGIEDNCAGMNEALEPITRWRAQFDIGNFKYDDIDNDGVMDIIFSKKGDVVCFDLNGNTKWHYKITLDDFDDVYKTRLLESLRDRVADTLNHKDIDANFREIFRKLIYDNMGVEKASEIYSRDITLESEGTSLETRKIIRPLVFEKLSLEDAWKIGTLYVSINKIIDYDNDGFKEVLVTAEGAMFVISHDGKRQDINIDGGIRKHITILDGTHFDIPTAIGDINGDGAPEIIVYKVPGFAINQRTGENLATDKSISNENELVYVYKENDIFNARGIYVADSVGREIWHLNLPWHNKHTGICDWDNDGKNEIIIDTHTPRNGYVVRYTNEYRNYVGKNFDWNSLPNGFQDDRRNFPPELQDNSVASLILGMENNKGRIEYFLSYPNPSGYQFICSRCLQSGSKDTVDMIQYQMNYDKISETTSEWEYEPRVQSDHDFKSLGEEDGFPNLYNYPDTGLFSFKVGSETRRVFGLCPFNKVVMTDDSYRVLKSYTWDPKDPQEIEFPDEYKWSDRPDIQDVVVMDMGDLDGNGTMEFLVAFGELKPPYRTQKRSVIKILTDDLKEFHPERGWSTFIVEGTAKEARFDAVNNDGNMDIIILSDFAYFITPRK